MTFEWGAFPFLCFIRTQVYALKTARLTPDIPAGPRWLERELVLRFRLCRQARGAATQRPSPYCGPVLQPDTCVLNRPPN